MANQQCRQKDRSWLGSVMTCSEDCMVVWQRQEGAYGFFFGFRPGQSYNMCCCHMHVAALVVVDDSSV